MLILMKTIWNNVDDQILRSTLKYVFFFKTHTFIKFNNLDVHLSNVMTPCHMVNVIHQRCQPKCNHHILTIWISSCN